MRVGIIPTVYSYVYMHTYSRLYFSVTLQRMKKEGSLLTIVPVAGSLAGIVPLMARRELASYVLYNAGFVAWKNSRKTYHTLTKASVERTKTMK